MKGAGGRFCLVIRVTPLGKEGIQPRHQVVYTIAWLPSNAFSMASLPALTGNSPAAMPSTGITYADERLAILEFRNNDKAVSSSGLTYLGEIFRDLGANMGKSGLIIMTKENILQLLPPGKALEQCIGECEVVTGRKIGADYILSGKVIKISSEG